MCTLHTHTGTLTHTHYSHSNEQSRINEHEDFVENTSKKRYAHAQLASGVYVCIFGRQKLKRSHRALDLN